jgi:TolB protein
VNPRSDNVERTLVIGHRITALAAGAGGVWVTVGSDSAAQSASGRLVFDDGGHIDVMNADGTDRVELTHGRPVDSDPDWSPDGRRIVFSRSDVGNSYREANLYVMNADGSDVHQLTRGNVVDLNPDWSPDGAKIAFLCQPAGAAAGDICVVDQDGSHLTNLTRHPADQGRPAWSPDGTRIAFRRGDSLEVIKADGSGTTRIASGNADAAEWAPDGIRISYGETQKGSEQGVYLTDSSGDGSVKIAAASTGSTATIGASTWSPDATRIAVGGHFDSPGDIFVMYPDGTGLTRLTTDGRAGAPDWEPSR